MIDLVVLVESLLLKENCDQDWILQFLLIQANIEVQYI